MSTNVKRVDGREYIRPKLQDFQDPMKFLNALLVFVHADTPLREINRRGGQQKNPTMIQLYLSGAREIGSAAGFETISKGLQLTAEEDAVLSRWAFEQYKRRAAHKWFTKVLPTQKGSTSEAA